MNIFKQIYEFINNLFISKKYIAFSLVLLGIIFALSCSIFAFYMVAVLIFNHFIEIVTVLGTIFLIISGIIGLFSKNSTVSEPEPSIIEHDPIILESTYSLIRRNMAIIVADVSDLIKIKKPATLMQMDAPSHYDVVGNVPIYHYLFYKLEEKADVDVILGILQTTITQRLECNSFDGITQSRFLYESASYPSIMVDNVVDIGNFVQVDIAVVSASYCSYRKKRIYNAMSNGYTNSNIKDRDF